MSPTTYAVLRFVHIAAGVLWAGCVMYLGLMLEPVLRRLSAADYAASASAIYPRVSRALLGLYAAVLASGGLMFLQRFPRPGDAFVSGAGHAILLSLVLSLAAVGVGWALELPAITARISMARQDGDLDRARFDSLRDRAAWGGRTAAVLALLTTAAMAVQRFV